MKKIYSLILIISTLTVCSQSPAQSINYQGVARTPAGNPIGTSVGIRFEIHQGSGSGTIVFTEAHNATPNQFGIFNLKIGSQNTTGFAGIDWGQGPYHLEVSMDPTGGTSYTSISNQQLVSVPYALYAEKAKNATTTTITSSSNMTVTNLGVNNFSLSIPTYIAGSNVTITPTGGNIYLIDAANSASSVSPTTPWTSNLNNVFLVNGSNLVGIGNPNPTAKLEVNTGALPTLDAVYATTGTGNGVFGSTASTATSIAGVKGLNSNTGPGIFGSNTSGGTGVYGENIVGSASPNAIGVNGKTNSQGVAASGVLGENYGAGPGVYGYQGNGSAGSNGSGVFGVSNSSSAAGVQGINNNGNAGVAGIITSGGNSPNAHGVVGKTNSTSGSAAGVKGDNVAINGGSGVMGVTNSTLGAGVYGDNLGAGDGVYGRTSTTNSLITTAGVHGNHYGAGYGVYGIATSPNVVFSGVYGLNNGAGSGVLGITGSADVNAGGVYGINNGTGPGVKASIASFTVAGGMNTSLLIENGHIKSIQPNAPTVNTFSISGGISGATYTLQGCTDVKGSILAVATTTGLINIGGQITIKVNFNRPYVFTPAVVVSPSSDPGPMSYFVNGITPTSFNIVFKNNTPGNIPGSSFNFNFNYIVIE